MKVRLLLDTHTFLWAIERSPRLSATARNLVNDPANVIHVSVASLWEITIKQALGKLRVPREWEETMRVLRSRGGNSILGIELRDLDELRFLPQRHRDPFDRMLIAQCFARGLRLVSNDTTLDAYGVSRLW